MTDLSEAIFQELSRIESRQEMHATGTEEGLSPEVRRRMEEGRERAEEVAEALKLEQGANEALGEPMPGDVAGDAVQTELEESRRQPGEAGLSPKVRQRMAEGRAHVEATAADLAATQNESAAIGKRLPGDVAGEGLSGTIDDVGDADRAAAARAADS